MKILFSLLLVSALLVFYSCKDDVAEGVYEYHAHIYQPDTSVKQLGDTLHIQIEFESHTGATVHHINVSIFNSSNMAVAYNLPADPHVHATSGDYVYQDEVVLSGANGFAAGDWILKATVWGESDGEEEESETVNFHIDN